MSAYTDALERGRKIGAARAPKAEAIAMFCADVVPTLVGAVAPELVWTGAMARQMTFLEFGRLCADPMKVEELQWSETVTVIKWGNQYRLTFSDRTRGTLFGPYDFPQTVAQLFITALLPRIEARNAVLEAHLHDVAVREVRR